ncbi:MAG: ABC transporter ATP-binding protein [Desulfovermiculus sp.]
MGSGDAVRVDELGVGYGQVRVLESVSFFVPRGELLVVIGPNGSGKSTLLKTLAGILRPQSGHVDILGQDISTRSRREMARKVAFVPQQASVAASYTVLETVLMGRYPHQGLLGLDSARDMQVAREAMHSTRIDHLQDRSLAQLSGGELQRVLIARALCQEPEIMLLDEPTSSLDLAHQVRVMDLLEELHTKHELTVIMVAHDLNLASLYSERILLLREGTMAGHGPPRDVLTFENLETVFGCVLLVDESSLDHLPRITVIPGRYLDQNVIRSGQAGS